MARPVLGRLHHRGAVQYRKYLIALYIAYVDVTSGFGRRGAIILLLVWVYYSAQICSGRGIHGAYARRSDRSSGRSGGNGAVE